MAREIFTFFCQTHSSPRSLRRGLNYLLLNIKQRCFPFAGLLTVHFRDGRIGRWLLSEAGGGGSRRTEQIARLRPDLRNNSHPASRHPNNRGGFAEAASAQRLCRAAAGTRRWQTTPFPVPVRSQKICWSPSASSRPGKGLEERSGGAGGLAPAAARFVPLEERSHGSAGAGGAGRAGGSGGP